MPYFYLLDTNILSDLLKHPKGKIFSKIQEVGEETICTSIIVACELEFGAEKKRSRQLKERVALVLDLIQVLPLMPRMSLDYAVVRNYLETQGTSIGGNDLLIATHALNLGLTVVTDNIREFSRVPNLKVENWLKND